MSVKDGEGRRRHKGDNSTVGIRGPVPGRYFGNRRPIINRKSRKPLTSETVRRLYAGYVAANHTLCRGRSRAPTDRPSCLTKKIMRCVNFAGTAIRQGDRAEYINPLYIYSSYIMKTYCTCKVFAAFNSEYKKLTSNIVGKFLSIKLNKVFRCFVKNTMSYIYVKFHQII